MNTYIYAGNSSLLVVKDNDLNSVSSIRNHCLNIDWAWVIEEDGVLKFNGKEYDVSEISNTRKIDIMNVVKHVLLAFVN